MVKRPGVGGESFRHIWRVKLLRSSLPEADFDYFDSFSPISRFRASNGVFFRPFGP